MISLKNLFYNLRKKEVIYEGGFEVLRRLNGDTEFSRTQLLSQYGKSLYVFACVSKIAEKCSSIDLELFRVLNSRGEMKEIQTHPALDLLYKPNPFQTKSEFFKITFINKLLTGDAFWAKIRNKGGKVVELWNLRPDMMTVISDPVNFVKAYKFVKNDGTEVIFDPEDIVHIKAPDPLSQYLGMSPLRPAKYRIDTESYATKYQRDFFLNQARPDAIIKNSQTDLTAEQKEDIREGWNKRHEGIGRNSKIAILEGGLEYQQISISQREMDYIESMRFTRDDILVAFKVPKPIVAVTDDVNRANAETAMVIFLSENINPEMDALIEKVDEELISEDFGDEFTIDYVDPVPQNRELILKEYDTGLKNNYLLINEVRQKEGLPPIRGGWSFYRPLTDMAFGGLSTEDQTKIMKKVEKENIENEKIISGSNRPRTFSFKGKFWLKQKFEIYESLKEEAIKTCGKKSRKKKDEDRNWRPMITEAETKKAYAEMINKKVDVKTSKLKEAVAEFANDQEDRVAKKLKSKKSKKITLTVSQIFDKDEENGLAIEFITPYLMQYLKDSASEALDMISPQNDFTLTKRIQDTIKKRADEFAESVNSTTLNKLDATLAEGINAGESINQLSDRVTEVYQEFPTYRSDLIARTEATAANNEGLIEGFKQSEVATGKEWLNVGDDRVRAEHQDGIGVGGEIVALEKVFSNGLMYPMEPNCRCVIAPAFLE